MTSPRDIVRPTSLNFEANSIDDDIQKLTDHIKILREQDFDQVKEGELIKHHTRDKNDPALLQPTSPQEAEIQAMRYLKGLMLIAKNSEPTQQMHLLTRIEENYKNYYKKFDNAEERGDLTQGELTHWLGETCARDISSVLGVKPKDGRKQLVMARDLGILCEDHPAITTISENKNEITTEKSTHYKISNEYYNNEFFTDIENIENQKWFQIAQESAGFEPKESTWLSNFFKGNDFNVMKEKGIATPSSARWLPLPPNNQVVEISVNRNGIDLPPTRIMRTGSMIPYSITDDKLQKQVADKIIRELITSELKQQIADYKAKYGDAINQENFSFYVNYQTLMAPLKLERYYPHIDNNAKFVEFIHEVVKDLDKDTRLKESIYSETGANLRIRHTNSSVNRNAMYCYSYPDDNKIRREKVEAFEEIRDRVKTQLKPGVEDLDFRNSAIQQRLYNELHYSPELINELIERERACEALTSLLNYDAPFDKLERNQRNIMIAALETLAMGSEAFTMAGCKSARDRTGVYLCALKAMKENPLAMTNWNELEKGIDLAWKQGHTFRSMSYHVAVVKVELVHKKFMKALRGVTQEAINQTMKFSQKLPEYKVRTKSLGISTDNNLLVERASNIKAESGSITSDQAKSLVAQISRDTLQTKIQEGKETWNNKLNNFSEELNTPDLDKALASLREAQLNSKSCVLDMNGMKVRTYTENDSNVNASPSDLLGSGIDSARGALNIVKYSSIDDAARVKATEEIRNAVILSKEKITNISKNFDSLDEPGKLAALRQASNEYKTLDAQLAKILVESGCYKKLDKAGDGITESRDMLWTLSHQNEAVCTVRKFGDDGKPESLSFAKRITFTDHPNQNFGDQIWHSEFSSKHPWSGNFIKANPEVLDVSSTPMQRSIPNPANAWDESTILVNKDDSVKIISGIRMGITSVYQVKNERERQALTTQNHQQIISDKRLEDTAMTHINKWKGLTGDVINIPILHQTLVDPGNPRYLGNTTGENPRDMIKQKRIANVWLQESLDHKNIYYDPDGDRILINPEFNEIKDNFKKINFIVKEVNNGINIHEKMTDKTPRDIQQSRDLVLIAHEKLTSLQRVLERNNQGALGNDLAIVLNYIQNTTPAHPRKLSEAEQSSLNNISKALTDGIDGINVSAETQKDSLLLLQAAVNLTSFLSNSTGIKVIGYAKDMMDAAVYEYKHADLNDATSKSCYERIIAEQLGIRMGGCKSALDREGEVAELTSAMYREFHKENRILDYHDSIETKDKFLEDYVDTQHKHNMCEMITSTLGASDRETQGQAFHKETKFEKKISALYEGVRHPKVTAAKMKQAKLKVAEGMTASASSISEQQEKAQSSSDSASSSEEVYKSEEEQEASVSSEEEIVRKPMSPEEWVSNLSTKKQEAIAPSTWHLQKIYGDNFPDRKPQENTIQFIAKPGSGLQCRLLKDNKAETINISWNELPDAIARSLGKGSLSPEAETRLLLEILKITSERNLTPTIENHLISQFKNGLDDVKSIKKIKDEINVYLNMAKEEGNIDSHNLTAVSALINKPMDADGNTLLHYITQEMDRHEKLKQRDIERYQELDNEREAKILNEESYEYISASFNKTIMELYGLTKDLIGQGGNLMAKNTEDGKTPYDQFPDIAYYTHLDLYNDAIASEKVTGNSLLEKLAERKSSMLGSVSYLNNTFERIESENASNLEKLQLLKTDVDASLESLATFDQQHHLEINPDDYRIPEPVPKTEMRAEEKIDLLEITKMTGELDKTIKEDLKKLGDLKDRSTRTAKQLTALIHNANDAATKNLATFPDLKHQVETHGTLMHKIEAQMNQMQRKMESNIETLQEYRNQIAEYNIPQNELENKINTEFVNETNQIRESNEANISLLTSMKVALDKAVSHIDPALRGSRNKEINFMPNEEARINKQLLSLTESAIEQYKTKLYKRSKHDPISRKKADALSNFLFDVQHAGNDTERRDIVDQYLTNKDLARHHIPGTRDSQAIKLVKRYQTHLNKKMQSQSTLESTEGLKSSMTENNLVSDLIDKSVKDLEKIKNEQSRRSGERFDSFLLMSMDVEKNPRKKLMQLAIISRANNNSPIMIKHEFTEPGDTLPSTKYYFYGLNKNNEWGVTQLDSRAVALGGKEFEKLRGDKFLNFPAKYRPSYTENARQMFVPGAEQQAQGFVNQLSGIPPYLQAEINRTGAHDPNAYNNNQMKLMEETLEGLNKLQQKEHKTSEDANKLAGLLDTLKEKTRDSRDEMKLSFLFGKSNLDGSLRALTNEVKQGIERISGRGFVSNVIAEPEVVHEPEIHEPPVHERGPQNEEIQESIAQMRKQFAETSEIEPEPQIQEKVSVEPSPEPEVEEESLPSLAEMREKFMDYFLDKNAYMNENTKKYLNELAGLLTSNPSAIPEYLDQEKSKNIIIDIRKDKDTKLKELPGIIDNLKKSCLQELQFNNLIAAINEKLLLLKNEALPNLDIDSTKPINERMEICGKELNKLQGPPTPFKDSPKANALTEISRLFKESDLYKKLPAKIRANIKYDLSEQKEKLKSKLGISIESEATKPRVK